ncbi:MAG: hypothetical protein A4E57_00062 [Syntrophorhabdaceae bacterium PtaU1.Bin034]|nr:MAG: hypothetical protein A4E57_00062 [Syntrophorhabdaceae bacterium PtaU1.Bin034]
MKRLSLLFLLFLVAGCALIQKKAEIVQWPSDVAFLEGEGDIDTAWKKERFSGSFVIRMEYPDILLLEVFGPFGQTLVYVSKEADRFLLVAGEEKTTDEALFRKTYGFSVQQFIDDLALKGQTNETPEGSVAERRGYKVIYSQDNRGRRKMCWQGAEGRICLTFSDISFVRQ